MTNGDDQPSASPRPRCGFHLAVQGFAADCDLAGGKPFAFAGLWEWWRDPANAESEPIESCTIITTDANKLARDVHDRMPVILDAADYDAWLACKDVALVPFDPERMTARPVNRWVNNARNQGEKCIAPPD